EGLLEFHQIGEWTVGAVTRWRMRIRVHLQLQIFIPLFRFPNRGEGQEKALLGCEPVSLLVSRPWIFIECLLQCRVRDFDSANVGNVLALGELAIDMHAGER